MHSSSMAYHKTFMLPNIYDRINLIVANVGTDLSRPFGMLNAEEDAINRSLQQTYPHYFIKRQWAQHALRPRECSILAFDFGADTGTNSTSTLTNGELHTLFHRDWLD